MADTPSFAAEAELDSIAEKLDREEERKNRIRRQSENSEDKGTQDSPGRTEDSSKTQKKQKKKKEPRGERPPGIEPKPKLTKAERRALQEKQKAEKAARQTGGSQQKQQKQQKQQNQGDKKRNSQLSIDGVVATVSSTAVKSNRREKKEVKFAGVNKHIELFSHIPQRDWDLSPTTNIHLGNTNIHPAFIDIGLKMARGVLYGSNARAVAFLQAFKELLHKHRIPPGKEVRRYLGELVKVHVNFLTKCRRLSVSMGNSINFVKGLIQAISPDAKDDEQVLQDLIDDIDIFIKERIVMAREAVIDTTAGIIHNGDVILVYGYSEVVIDALVKAKQSNPEKNFRVVVVDSRPLLKGRQVLASLRAVGLDCSYVLITSISYVLREVTKVIVHAHALLANGYVVSNVGTSLICMMAKDSCIPVLVACETYKFSERTQADSFVNNELGNPAELVDTAPQKFLSGWRDSEHLVVLNFVFEVTPPNFIDAIVTEVGQIPCSSAPVVIREYKVSSDMPTN
eukprot:Clim_evm23s199 gene=Clim_evmTU23s199